MKTIVACIKLKVDDDARVKDALKWLDDVLEEGTNAPNMLSPGSPREWRKFYLYRKPAAKRRKRGKP